MHCYTPYTMLLEQLIGLGLFTVAATQCDFARDSQNTWWTFDGHCYYASQKHDTQNYQAALNSCLAYDSYLLSAIDQSKTNFTMEYLIDCHQEGKCDYHKASDQFWIGLNKNLTALSSTSNLTEDRSGWSWLSKEVYEWQNWHDGEPDDNTGYVRMQYDGTWADEEPNNVYRYICERADSTTKSTTTTTTARYPSGSPKTALAAGSPGAKPVAESSTPTTIPNTTATTSSVPLFPSRPYTPYTDVSSLRTTDASGHQSSTDVVVADDDDEQDTGVYIAIGTGLGGTGVVIAVIILIVCFKRRTTGPKLTNGVNGQTETSTHPPVPQLPGVNSAQPDTINLPVVHNDTNSPAIKYEMTDGRDVNALFTPQNRGPGNLKVGSEDDDDDDEVTMVDNVTYATT